MKIVVDTNVLISGVFFGGIPGKVIEAIVNEKVIACATEEIIDEYVEIIERMILDKQGKLNIDLLNTLINSFELIISESNIDVSRDPDDNKFIECAIDGKALYIVSGDEDLLVLKHYNNIQIITAKQFCDKYMLL